jgi:hypothetical protein
MEKHHIARDAFTLQLLQNEAKKMHEVLRFICTSICLHYYLHVLLLFKNFKFFSPQKMKNVIVMPAKKVVNIC